MPPQPVSTVPFSSHGRMTCAPGFVVTTLRHRLQPISLVMAEAQRAGRACQVGSLQRPCVPGSKLWGQRGGTGLPWVEGAEPPGCLARVRAGNSSGSWSRGDGQERTQGGRQLDGQRRPCGSEALSQSSPGSCGWPGGRSALVGTVHATWSSAIGVPGGSRPWSRQVLREHV